MAELHKKSNKIQELDITCKELQEEAISATIKLQKISFLKNQEENANRFSYAKNLLQNKAQQRISETIEENSLDKQINQIEEKTEKPLLVEETKKISSISPEAVENQEKIHQFGEILNSENEPKIEKTQQILQEKIKQKLSKIPEKSLEKPQEKLTEKIDLNNYENEPKNNMRYTEAPRVSKITNFDFLNLRANPKLIKIAEIQKECEISPMIFSDFIYILNPDTNLENKYTKILYINTNYFIILHETSFTVEALVSLEDLRSFVFIKSSGSLTVLGFEKLYIFYFIKVLEEH